jgi:hypothetical protein
MSTISFKVSDIEKEQIDTYFDEIMNKLNLNKGEAFVYIVEEHQKNQIEKKVNPSDYIPPNVQDVLRNIQCKYLLFDEESFYCLENFERKKERQLLNGTPRQVETNCELCIQRKLDDKQEQLFKMKQKQSIKRLEKWLKGFMLITEKGVPTTIYICGYDAIQGKFQFASYEKTLNCPLIDDAENLVDVHEICLKRLNPDTGTTPCQYLSEMPIEVELDKEFWDQAEIHLPQLDINLSTPQVQEHHNPEKRQTIEAEVTVLDSPIMIAGNGKGKFHLETCKHYNPSDVDEYFNDWFEVLEMFPKAEGCKVCKPENGDN